MNLKTFSTIGITLIILLFSACIKPEEYSEIPEITNVTINKSMIPNRGTFEITVYFQDSGGDMGLSPTDSSANIFIIDNRIEDVDSFSIPNIPDRGVTSSIEGNIKIDVPLECCIPILGAPCNPNSTYPEIDTLILGIQIKDRSNNFSQIVDSPPILIECNNFE